MAVGHENASSIPLPVTGKELNARSVPGTDGHFQAKTNVHNNGSRVRSLFYFYSMCVDYGRHLGLLNARPAIPVDADKELAQTHTMSPGALYCSVQLVFRIHPIPRATQDGQGRGSEVGAEGSGPITASFSWRIYMTSRRPSIYIVLLFCIS